MAKWKKDDIIDSIIKMRIERGASTKTIIKDFLQGELKFKQSYAYVLYREARDKITSLYDTQNKVLANEALAQLEAMYEKAIGAGENKLALEVRKEINKLVGAYAPEKMDLTSDGEKINEVRLIQITKKDDA